MICYRDRAFCSYWKACNNGEDCSRKLDDNLRERAKEFGLPICEFVDPPKDCFEEK